ncbi:hypothetical protein BD309DRAFT_874878 [Dichomitus squalens]|nr:hypothetical protein BD309DRAFT_874878 [Dichomitus squalens]
MSHRATAYSVELERDSLYISTLPLPSNVFHWALVHVDPEGAATRHHWAATTIDPTGPEAYVEQALPNGPISLPTSRFRITDYNPVDVTKLRDVCSSIFPLSYPTAQDNRRANITCRTWITHILGRLISDERAREVEEAVKKHSTVCSNTYATDFLFQRPYEVQVYIV